MAEPALKNTNLIRYFLECVNNDSDKLQEFLLVLVEYTKGVNENVTKRVRAEVLAACIAKAKQHRDWAKQSKELDGEIRAQEIVDALSMLQPAAADLEEHDRQLQIETYEGARKLWERDLEKLLRKEWNKAIEVAANAAWDSMVGPGMYDEDDVTAEIRALCKEKARAIEEKG